MGQIFAHITATAVEFTGDESDDYTERHGWIDPMWSMTVLHDSRNDATAVINLPEDDEDLGEQVRDALGDLSAYEDNGDGSFYAADSRDVDGVSWTYALHFRRKFFGPGGWTEQPWHPITDGGISLADA